MLLKTLMRKIREKNRQKMSVRLPLSQPARHIGPGETILYGLRDRPTTGEILAVNHALAQWFSVINQT
jgi:hypothetical protein